MSVAGPWTHLHIFHTVKSWREFIADLQIGTTFAWRINPRIEGFWDDENGDPYPIHHGGAAP